MPLIEGKDRVHYDQVIVDAELDVDDFEITKESELPGLLPSQWYRLGHCDLWAYVN